MVHHCCAIGCTKSSDLHRNLKFHRFPLKNVLLLRKWIKAVRRKDFIPTKSTKICSDHFMEDDYCGRNLSRTAVPSIFNFAAANQGKSKKVLAEEEDIVFPEEPQSGLPELCTLPCLDTPEQRSSPLESLDIKKWDPLEELGLDSNQVELHFEDDLPSGVDKKPKQSCLSISNASCNEKSTQTFLIKCKMCVSTRDKFRLLRKQIKRREEKIKKLQNLITSFKEQIADSKKRKIKVVGNSIILIDKLDKNRSIADISINEQYQVALSVS